jgi:hypothetical protein
VVRRAQARVQGGGGIGLEGGFVTDRERPSNTGRLAGAASPPGANLGARRRNRARLTISQDPLAIPTDELDFLATLDAAETRARDAGNNLPYGGTGWREDLTRRLRVLLHAEPLLAMRAADSKQQPDRRHYDSLTIALRVCDFVLGNMGLDEGIDRSDVQQELRPLLAAMDAAEGVDPEPSRYEAVVDRVLGALRNDDERMAQFQAEYTDIRPDGHAERVHVPFRLVEDYLAPSGRTVLRLTSEAINLYLGALDRDIEDEQVATEALIREQLERGSFAKALRSAQDALLQSRRYEEFLRSKIKLTQRDVHMVDWAAEMAPVIDSAHEHVQRRLSAERLILGTAHDQQQRLTPGTDEAQQVAKVQQLVRDCCSRHARLTEILAGARFTFLDEQGRQGFAAAIARAQVNIVRDLLEPVMLRPIGEAVGVADITLTTIGSPRAPGLLNLDLLLGWCLKPRRDVPTGDVPVVELDVESLPEPLLRFTPATRQAATVALTAMSEPTLLSSLLADGYAAGWADALVDCVTLLAHLEHGRDPEHQPIVDVVRTRRRFSAAGVVGDDLILFPRGGTTDRVVSDASASTTVAATVAALAERVLLPASTLAVKL